MLKQASKAVSVEDIGRLRVDCVLGSKVGIGIFSGLAAMAYRDHGERDLFEVWRRLMSGAQSDRLLDGMRKLGIRDDEPPAVRAAKYHYFSNNLGGLNLEYIEESPKKVWLRYRGPYQMMPGIAAIVFPPTLRRFQFSSWHPKNRHFLNQPRLGWVYTKTTLEGDPYDEGYFIEYDHDINDTIADGSEVVLHTPEFDSSRAPTLDPVAWPEARQLKARRNYALGYVALALEILMSMYGQLEARHMVDKTMKILATQNGVEWIGFLGIRGTDLAASVELTSALLRAQGQEISTRIVSPTRTIVPGGCAVEALVGLASQMNNRRPR